MLGSAVPAAATLQTSTSTATPTSPSRPSRLRGLSYLRNYSLHSRSEAAAPQLARSTSSPGTPAAQSPTSPREVTGSSSRAQDEFAPSIQNGENGWLPTVQGRSGLSRASLHPTESTESASPELHSGSAMPRTRSVSAQAATSAAEGAPPPLGGDVTRPLPTDSTDIPPGAVTGRDKENLPTIRFIPHIEPRAHRPSLNFTTISRTLKQPHSVVRVGRYSERESSPHSSAVVTPVGFKSKVVSRRHCEFWCANGQWYVKDVKSSSGTFLNHVRLSSPGMESRPYPVNDGDVVQLGIDFKGGEEVIFRCVKIRVECNRGWQRGVNSFNTETHKRVLKQNNPSSGEQSTADVSSPSECSICLNPCAPCQSLFVSQCGHVWHFKCVRTLVNGPHYPNFLCPNCRAVVDLEADVEQPEDAEIAIPEENEEVRAGSSGGDVDMDDDRLPSEGGQMARWSELLHTSTHTTDENGSEDLAETMGGISIHQPHDAQETSGSTVASVPIPQTIVNGPSEHDRSHSADLRAATPTSSAPFALAAEVNTSTRTSTDLRRQREQREQHGPRDESPARPEPNRRPFSPNGTLAQLSAQDMELLRRQFPQGLPADHQFVRPAGVAGPNYPPPPTPFSMVLQAAQIAEAQREADEQGWTERRRGARQPFF